MVKQNCIHCTLQCQQGEILQAGCWAYSFNIFVLAAGSLSFSGCGCLYNQGWSCSWQSQGSCRGAWLPTASASTFCLAQRTASSYILFLPEIQSFCFVPTASVPRNIRLCQAVAWGSHCWYFYLSAHSFFATWLYEHFPEGKGEHREDSWFIYTHCSFLDLQETPSGGYGNFGLPCRSYQCWLWGKEVRKSRVECPNIGCLMCIQQTLPHLLFHSFLTKWGNTT